VNPSDSGEHTAELRELEPNILPAQRRALERVAVRLSAERPVADPAFRAELDARMHELAGGAPAASRSWRLWAGVCLASGLALLLLAVVLVVIGEPGGH
jgi:hypothetical protein